MILAAVLIVAAALSLVAILAAAISRSLLTPAGASLASQVYPLDIEAFRNLADPAEDAYLRRRLPVSEYRMVRRARLRALAAYVQTAGRNATILFRVGQDALASSDAATAEAARELANQALLLRHNAALVLLRIYLAMAWPNSRLAAGPILERYNRLSGAAMLLGRLQNPAVPVRIVVW
jgi:hypothetical protein